MAVSSEKVYNGATKALYQSPTNKVTTFILSGMHLRVGGANKNLLLKTTKKKV